MTDPDLFAIRIIVENRKGVLRDISTVVARHEANVLMIHQEIFDSGPFKGTAELYLEFENGVDQKGMIQELLHLPSVREVKPYEPFSNIYGTRVIIIGGGAQVAQVRGEGGRAKINRQADGLFVVARLHAHDQPVVPHREGDGPALLLSRTPE